MCGPGGLFLRSHGFFFLRGGGVGKRAHHIHELVKKRGDGWRFSAFDEVGFFAFFQLPTPFLMLSLNGGLLSSCSKPNTVISKLFCLRPVGWGEGSHTHALGTLALELCWRCSVPRSFVALELVAWFV